MMLEIVLSLAVLLCLIIILFGCLDCLFKKKNRFEPFGIRSTTHAERNAAFSVDIFDADSISEQVVIEPLPDILSKVSSVPVLRPRITCIDRGKQEATHSLLSVHKSFPRNHLTYLNEIGTGWFGKVIQSEAVQIIPANYNNHVVVKMLRDDGSKLEQRQFIEEVNAFRCLEHANLISLLGQCTETTPHLVIMEYAAHGDLKSYLVDNRRNVDTLISTNRLVSFAADAASGLACLHRHDYLHNDLAARNCLIMSNFTLKIGDYGISENLYKDEYYNNGTELLPIRWMAPETLYQKDGVWTSHNCSKMSDVWSFGILLWEICSLGERPYNYLTNESVLQNVVLNRQELPADVGVKLPFKVKLWSLMIQCWVEPSQRMNVEQSHLILEQLKVYLDTTAVNSDFDQKWNNLQKIQAKKTSITPDNRTTLVNFVANNTSSIVETKSLFTNGLYVQNETFLDQVVIDIDSTRNVLNEYSDDSGCKLTMPTNQRIDHDYGLFQQNDSANVPTCQVMVVNESQLVSGSDSIHSLDQQLTTSHACSTTQYYSPQSSLSGEYITISEASGADIVLEETSKELNINHTKGSFNEMIDDSITPQLSNLVNNNNLSKCVSHSQNEGTKVCTSPEAQIENLLNAETSVTAGSNSFIKAELFNKDKLCNSDTLIFKTDNVFASDKSDSDLEHMRLANKDTALELTRLTNNDANIDAISLSSDTISSSDHTALPYESLCNVSKNLSVFKSEARVDPKDSVITMSGNQSGEIVDETDVDKDITADAHSSLSHIIKEMLVEEGSCQSLEVNSFQSDSSSDFINLHSRSSVALSEHVAGVEPPYPPAAVDVAGVEPPHPSAAGDVADVEPPYPPAAGDVADVEPPYPPAAVDVTDVEPPHPPAAGDDTDGNENVFGLSLDKDSSVGCTSESLDHEILSDLPELISTSLEGSMKTDTVQAIVESPGKNESNSTESGIHTHSMTESIANNAINDSEIDSSMYHSSSPVYNADTNLSDASVANLQEADPERDTWPVNNFKSNLYRCSHIDLTASSQNLEKTQKNTTDSNEHDDDSHEKVEKIPVEDESENSTSNSDSEQEYTCLGSQGNLKQPMTSSPDTASVNKESKAGMKSFSPVEFDDYALQLASEIYLSRGLKSPRAYEIPPLETIPEHQPMSEIQDESNYTPSDTSSVEVKYDELFGSDSYEWDDFYGDPLIGKDISLQNSLHQHNSSFKEHDISDWTMDIDSESNASGIIIASGQSEISLNATTQSELPSSTDFSFESGSSLFSSNSHPVTTISDSSKETLMSSILSHLQSPSIATKTSVQKSNFYSLTGKYDLTDSSSDGFASLPAVVAFNADLSPLTPPTGSTPIENNISNDSSHLPSSYSNVSDQHIDQELGSLELGKNISISDKQEENQQQEFSNTENISSVDKMGSLLTPVAENANNGEDQAGGVYHKSGVNILNAESSVENSSSTM